MKYWDISKTLVEGCTPISEGCLNCWSADIKHRFGKSIGSSVHHTEFTNIQGKWNGNIRIREDRIPELLKGKKPKVLQIWNDLFHPSVDSIFIKRTYAKAFRSVNQILILTKRAKRMADILWDFPDGLDNIWNGVTAENQQRADERIPYLLQIPGQKWLSLEPLLSEITLPSLYPLDYIFDPHITSYDVTSFGIFGSPEWWKPQVHQIIVGCETGRNTRPCRIEWIESIVNQCREAGIPCFVKTVNINGKITSDINKFPESVRVRELAWRERRRHVWEG